MRLLSAAAAAAFLLLGHGVTSLELNIDPVFKVINDRENITVMCRASASISDCQFTWWDLDYEDEPGFKFDFHLGPDSDGAYKENSSEINWRLAGYSYVGNGLDLGECGIQLLGVHVKYMKLSCRARESGKGWKYAFMTIIGNGASNVSTHLTLSPSEQSPVVLPHRPFTIASRAESRVKQCSFRFNVMDPIVVCRPDRTNTRFNTSSKKPREQCQQPSRSSESNFWVTRGPPLHGNECTITVKNVSENLNGLVYFEAVTEAGQSAKRIFYLVVAEAPSTSSLVFSKKSVSENEFLEATCIVGPSRPQANITWYLDEAVIRQDPLDDSSPENQNDSPWRWNHERNGLSQTLVLLATRDLHGKQIKCEVMHVGLPEPKFSVKTINVISIGGSSDDAIALGTETRVMCRPVPPRPGVEQYCWYGSRPVNCLNPMEEGSKVRASLQCPVKSPYSQGIFTCLATGFWDIVSLNCQPGTETRVMCPPMTPRRGVEQYCWTGSRQVDCSKSMEVGTVVRTSLQCSEKSPHAQGNITCLPTGKWETPFPRCQSGCGTPKVSIQTIPSQGQAAVQGQFPWHVAIYKLKDKKYEQVCSGSLLSSTTIITAASCFVRHMWDGRQFNSSLYKVAAGKLHREWASPDENVQTREVTSLSVSPYFGGESSNYNFNLAFLKVAEPFRQTQQVGPVCFDRNHEQSYQTQFMKGKDGFMAGWGYLEEDQPGPTLVAVRLPHVGLDTCEQQLGVAAQRLVTVDTFCAGSTQDLQGYTACETDYGSGIVFLDEALGKFFLRGVSSVALKPATNNETCYPSNLFNFATFHVLDSWLRDNLDTSPAV